MTLDEAITLTQNNEVRSIPVTNLLTWLCELKELRSNKKADTPLLKKEDLMINQCKDLSYWATYIRSKVYENTGVCTLVAKLIDDGILIKGFSSGEFTNLYKVNKEKLSSLDDKYFENLAKE